MRRMVKITCDFIDMVGESSNLTIVEEDASKIKLIETISRPKQDEAWKKRVENLVKQFTQNVENLQSEEELRVLEKSSALDTLTLQRMKGESSNLSHTFVTTDPTSSNKKIMPQRRLFATKKQRVKKIPKPRPIENIIANQLLLKKK